MGQDFGELRTRPWEELLERLRLMLLAPDESNHGQLVKGLECALAALPRTFGPNDPYIGAPDPDMSRLAAYETVPDKGTDPGAVVAAGLGALRGQMRWHSLAVLHNVTQPVLTTAWLAHAVTSLYNPNALWDLVSGGYLDMERQVVRQLSRLMGWDAGACDGLFTFGGKAGLLYAIRLGLNRCVPDLSRSGLGGASPMVLTTDQNHYSVDSACSLVGIGTDAVIKVPTNARGSMDHDAFRAIA